MVLRDGKIGLLTASNNTSANNVQNVAPTERPLPKLGGRGGTRGSADQHGGAQVDKLFCLEEPGKIKLENNCCGALRPGLRDGIISENVAHTKINARLRRALMCGWLSTAFAVPKAWPEGSAAMSPDLFSRNVPGFI